MPPRYLYGRYRGLFDFYTWKGVVCVRQWPMEMTATPAAKATWNNMIRSSKVWKRMPEIDKQAYIFFAQNAKLTCRDVFEHYDMTRGKSASYNELSLLKIKKEFIHIQIRNDSGPLPLIRWAFHPGYGVSSFTDWRGPGEVYCRALATTWMRPVFRCSTLSKMFWPGPIGLIKIPRSPGNLFFILVDDTCDIGYCSGVYFTEIK